MPAEIGEPGRGVGAARLAEHPLEHDARIVLGRQRRRRAAPRDGVEERAACPVAGAADVAGIQRELERRQRRVLAECPRRELVDRRTSLHAVAGLQAGHPGQESVDAAGVRRLAR